MKKIIINPIGINQKEYQEILDFLYDKSLSYKLEDEENLKIDTKIDDKDFKLLKSVLSEKVFKYLDLFDIKKDDEYIKIDFFKIAKRYIDTEVKEQYFVEIELRDNEEETHGPYKNIYEVINFVISYKTGMILENILNVYI